MSAMVILHKINSFTHDGMHKNSYWLTLPGQGFGLFESSYDSIHDITIGFQRFPAKSVKFQPYISRTYYSISVVPSICW